jgi:RNA polymerase sigma-70 factor (ECF subfamily)
MGAPALTPEELTGGIDPAPASQEEGSDEGPLPPYERLNQGDVDAVETIVSAYEPYLRKVVRRQLPQRLRAKFDSSDVVQSVWASVLKGLREDKWQFTDETHLRAFLVRLALFRFIELCRQYRASLKCERPLAGIEELGGRPALCDRPSEILQAGDVLDRLMKLCLPSHRELIRLRAMGIPLAEIASRTGFHESSVRRIFYDLARRLEAGEGTAPEQSCAAPKGPNKLARGNAPGTETPPAEKP